jgi:predicted nucleic acid-binding protein
VSALLIDLNVLLDVLLDRSPFAEPAAELWAACESGEVDGLLAAHSVTTLHYLAGRSRGRAFAERCLTDVLSVFGVAAVDRAVLEDANDLGWADFEDAVCAEAAVASGCVILVTRDLSGFRRARLPAMGPREALAALRSA